MIVFPLKPSERLKKVLIIMHLLALCASFANALPIMLQCLLAIALLIQYRFVGARCKPAWQVLRYSKALGWEMADSLECVAVRILPDTVVTTFALFLHVEIQGSHTHINHSSVLDRTLPKNRQTLLILPDSLGQDDYRGLVVKLKTTYKIKSKSSNLLVKSV